jgi:diguanylate cyclase (GGDEF)-like protein/PAS domain S-box-containing protein
MSSTPDDAVFANQAIMLNIANCQTILDSILDGVYITDRERRIIFWNPGAQALTGYAADEVLGRRCSDNILNHVTSEGMSLCMGECPLSKTLRDGQGRVAEVFLHHRQGHRVPVTVKVGPLRDETGEIVGAIEVFSDNSAKIAALERIDRLTRESLVDPLTGVGNRRYAEIVLRNRFDEKERYDWPSAIMFCDLDHFKRVNDVYGHDVGDAVLRMTAQTMKGFLRSFDFVGRWGGEEFLLCMPNVTSEADLANMGERLRSLVEHSRLDTPQGEVRVTISIGATLVSERDTIDSAFKRADAMLYRSKNEGRNRVSVG